MQTKNFVIVCISGLVLCIFKVQGVCWKNNVVFFFVKQNLHTVSNATYFFVFGGALKLLNLSSI